MAFLPSKKDFQLGSQPPALRASSQFSWLVVFIVGAIFIILNTALALGIVGWGDPTPWIVLPFLGGLVPAAIFSKLRRQRVSVIILFLAAVPAMTAGFMTQVAPLGRIVNLQSVTAVPVDSGVAGYAAPGWHIETAHAGEISITSKRSTTGKLTVAPLVPEGWTINQPVSVWVTAVAFKSGKIGPLHPSHWSQAGEYPRLVGNFLSTARIAARDAAQTQGLTNAKEPVFVIRADNAMDAIRDQAFMVAEILAAVLCIWALAVFGVSSFESKVGIL